MIREIIFTDRAGAIKKISNFNPPIILAEFYAAILIHDPKRQPVNLPKSISPVLRLECECSIFATRYHFNELMAERTITFLDYIESSNSRFCLFIQSERGLNRSAAIAKFIGAAIRRDIACTGLVKPLKDCVPDPVIMRLLTKEWTKKVAIDAEKYIVKR